MMLAYGNGESLGVVRFICFVDCIVHIGRDNDVLVADIQVRDVKRSLVTDGIAFLQHGDELWG